MIHFIEQGEVTPGHKGHKAQGEGGGIYHPKSCYTIYEEALKRLSSTYKNEFREKP